MKFFKKSYTYAACFGLLLTSSFSYSMLKTFVLSDAIQTVKATTTDTKAAKKAAASAITTDTSYSDDNIQVSLTEKTVENTQVYIADITVSSSDYLKTAFAQNTYGTNVTAKTSVTAANNNAILAVNGDYYGANSTGYVIRNGVVYRDTVREDSSNGDLAIYKDGSFKIIYEDEISADQLVKDGVVNLLAFGPSLVENGEIRGIKTKTGMEFCAKAVVLATGTFLRGLLYIGDKRVKGGRMGELSADDLTSSLKSLGLKMGRFKTGTPPRLDIRTLNLEKLEEQPGITGVPLKFSMRTPDEEVLEKPQLSCYLTRTNLEAHKIILDNLDKAKYHLSSLQ